MTKMFSQKMLYEIEDRKTKGHSINKIARDLKITPTVVKNGLNKLYENEMKDTE